MHIEDLLELWETAHGSLAGPPDWRQEFRTRIETERIVEFHDEDIERYISQEMRLAKILELLETTSQRRLEYPDLPAQHPPNVYKRLREINPEDGPDRTIRHTQPPHDEAALRQLWQDSHGELHRDWQDDRIRREAYLVREVLRFPWAAIAEVTSAEPLLSEILSELRKNWTVVPPIVAQANLPYQ